MKINKLKQLQGLGQSIWLDSFDREMLDSGKLKKMMDEDGISGITSNPSIFEKAIRNSTDYDEDIRSLLIKKRNYDSVFFSLAVKDIQRACDLFEPLYQKTNGRDGFASIEVSPHLAYDTEGTIRQARELWEAVNRRNVMIKIPATAEGLPAIKTCISEGININITLLFGLPRYEEVIEAYLSGLEDRVQQNKPIDQIKSVASFFLSRIDLIIDPLVKSRGYNELQGEVAIASAKKAYEIYKNIFWANRFKALEEKGAKRQFLLWASTSTKDPAYSDVKYVSALIGPETINTVTMETLAAFRDHGNAESHLEDDTGHATQVLQTLKHANIDIDSVTQKLEEEGVEKFNASYDEIITAIKKKQTGHLA
jgi:transaldolase/transaldolase/glucose-6-phosphate isomerase